MIIFRANRYLLREEEIKQIESDIRRQLPTGAVVVPACVDVMVAAHDDSGCVFKRADEAKEEPYCVIDGVAFYGRSENG
jgi:hypothetical protein